MMELLSDGLTFDGVQYTIELSAIICDSFAQQFFKSMNWHRACECCTEKGVHIEEHKFGIFPLLKNVVLCTDDSFRKQRHKNHHTGTSPFGQLDIDMISSFPLDYMHLVLLGVFKRLILIWTRQWHKKKHKLGIRERANIDKKLRQIRKMYTKESVELRSFLFYSGPAVLKGNLSYEQCEHFI